MVFSLDLLILLSKKLFLRKDIVSLLRNVGKYSLIIRDPFVQFDNLFKRIVNFGNEQSTMQQMILLQYLLDFTVEISPQTKHLLKICSPLKLFDI